MTTRFDVSSKKITSVWSAFTTKIAPLFSSQSISKQIFAMMLVPPNSWIFYVRTQFSATDLERLKDFVIKSRERGVLTDWRVAIKRVGMAKFGFGSGVIPRMSPGAG